MKVYAVKAGRNPGIYEIWDDQVKENGIITKERTPNCCMYQIDKFSGNKYKSFTLPEQQAELDAFMEVKPPQVYEPREDDIVVYTDGSCKKSTGDFSGAFVIIKNNIPVKIESTAYFATEYPEMAKMNNIAGEIMAVIEAFRYIYKKYKKGRRIIIFHDYSGIQNWVNGDFEARNVYTQEYLKACNIIKESFELEFYNIKGHNNIKWNEYVDEMAKNVLGIFESMKLKGNK